MKAPFVRSAYNYDMMAASNEAGLLCEDVSLAVQASRDEVDINTIVRRFGLTGQLPQDVRAPIYGDFTGISDYQGALNAVLEADASFAALPAYIRAQFGNNPSDFVDFASDPKNSEQLGKWGMLTPKVDPDLTLREVVAALQPSKVASGSSGKPSGDSGAS